MPGLAFFKDKVYTKFFIAYSQSFIYLQYFQEIFEKNLESLFTIFYYTLKPDFLI